MITADASTTATIRGATSSRRAKLEAALFVGVWTALGLAMRAPMAYLLVGIPLTAAFQIGIRRRPLRELWVRDGSPFRLDAMDRLVAGLLAVGPASWPQP